MNKSPAVLELFHPIVKQWFLSRFPGPTAIQSQAWPVISSGEHVLITAPTGDGKTLTAFLWAINNLITGKWQTGRLQVLYISPLKALNNDIRTNLLSPLAELQALFTRAGSAFPVIRVLTRSGDTPQQERRRMIKHPPEILITTPESLNLLLSSVRVRPVLTTITTVILDEIHALAASKRGTYLITAVDRLVQLAGEFQRVALSATVNPLQTIADFTGGYRLENTTGKTLYTKRPVRIIRAKTDKKIKIQVVFPEDARETMVEGSWWPSIVNAIRQLIKSNRSTLIFTNSRALCEKMTRWLNENEPVRLAYAHHGSLAKELRREVEKQLKAGQLAAIVATSSLELGIDIGELDQVVLVQCPYSVSSACQRIGRAGHAVGKTSYGSIFPTHGRDFLEAALMAECIMQQEIEAITPVSCPLDILAQVILSMTGTAEWQLDTLYAVIRTSYPFHDLSRGEFDLVIKMLTGWYAETKIRELHPRISLNRMNNTVSARPGTLLLIYASGGTIPDRGYFEMRTADSHALIGELDEEFVWERRLGHTFNLGTQDWKITRIDEQKVEVVPWNGPINTLPFWKAEQSNSTFFFAEKTACFLEEWNNRLDSVELENSLTSQYCLNPAAARELIGYLQRQRKATKAALPHRHHMLIEQYMDLNRKAYNKIIIIHTLWGGRINHPFALALGAALEQEQGYNVEIFTDNSCIMLLLPGESSGQKLSRLVTTANLEQLLRGKLEKTGFFGARFRENAGRALLLPRSGFKTRTPLWLNRLRAKKLLEAVLPFTDFPILVETWRSCIRDEFDLPQLKMLLEELATGKIAVTEIETNRVSPFAEGLIWRQTDKHMYEDDTPASGRTSQLQTDIFRQVIFSPGLLPQFAVPLCGELRQKLQRTYPGYAPATARELLDLITDRILIPLPEWQELLAAIARDHQLEPAILLRELAGRAVFTRLPGSAFAAVAIVDQLPGLWSAPYYTGQAVEYYSLSGREGFDPGAKQNIDDYLAGCLKPAAGPPASFAGLLVAWLTCYGPLTIEYLQQVFGLDARLLQEILETTAAEGLLVTGRFSHAAPADEICTRDNLEILLRLTRQRARPHFTPLDLSWLPLFLALHGNLAGKHDNLQALQGVLEKLFGCPAPASLWESELLPARLPGYRTAWLDELLQTSDLLWFGCGRQKITFCLAADLELYPVQELTTNQAAALFPHSRGRFSFWELKDFTGLDSQHLTEKLWQAAWEGQISNDAFTVIRTGIAGRFKADPGLPMQSSAVRSSRRGGFQRWKTSRPVTGSWFLLERQPLSEEDLLYQAEINRDRIRQLLQRYGILCRELLSHELAGLNWSGLFKSLRIMELSGELVSGYFFTGLMGIQFCSPRTLNLLQTLQNQDLVFWLNAADPLSLCGKGMRQFSPALPPRLPAHHLVYHGKELVFVSRNRGKDLSIMVPPDCVRLREYLNFFHTLLHRPCKPWKAVKVETINGVAAGKSIYKQPLLQAGFGEGYGCLVLRKKY